MLDQLWQAFLRLLGRAPAAKPAPTPPPPEMPASGDPAWLRLARQDLGLREVSGPASNPRILGAFKYCAYDPPDGDETAWCSAIMCEWMERSGIPSTKAPNARSWEKWGRKIDKPQPGCVAVLWRGSPTSWQGHVTLYLGPGSRQGYIKCLGGNQGNSVSVAEFQAAQVLSYRMPVTAANSRTLRASTAGTVGDVMTVAAVSSRAVIESAPDALAFSDGLQALASYWPYFAVAGIVLSLATRAIVIWARLSDWNEKAA